MTRKSLKNRIKFVIGLCFGFMVIGIALYALDQALFQTFRDFILLLIAIPATLLADYFQKRNNFEDALRTLWTNISHAVNEARQYTFRNETSEDLFRHNLLNLSKAIDDVRSVYKNLGEDKSAIGYYPFESLKCIYHAFENLGYGDLQVDKTENTRKELDHYWKNFKESFLWEFDRPEPESFNTPHAYGDVAKNNFKAFN
jgi:hypothetical protein